MSSLLSSILVSLNLLWTWLSFRNDMSSHPLAPRSGSEASPKLQLAAHTETANALAEKRSHGKISQKDYDAQIYSTTISSWDRVTSVPIILTLDDSLATLVAYAHREFQIPLVKAEKTKMYVLWSAKIFHAVGVHAVPENLVLLDQDRLNMILTFMKASPQVEQLFVQFEKDVSEVAAKLEDVAVKVDQAAAEDDTPAPQAEKAKVNARSSLKGKERSASRQGRERDRSSEASMAGHQQKMDLHVEESKHGVSRAKQEDTKQEPQARRESRITGSSSSASKGSSGKPPEQRGRRRGSK